MNNTANTQAEFISTPVETSGMWLIQYIDGISIEDIADAFPQGVMQGYREEERGYEGLEVGFRHPATGAKFYAYARWGQVRIGGYIDNLADPRIEGLTSLIRQVVAGGRAN